MEKSASVEKDTITSDTSDDDYDYSAFYSEHSALFTTDGDANASKPTESRKKLKLDDMNELALSDFRNYGIETNSAKDRLSYMMSFPKTLCNMMNCGDYEELDKLLDNTLHPECKLKTAAMYHELSGIETIKAYFRSIATTVPDLVMDIRNTFYSNRVITSQIYGTGTATHEDTMGYLYDVGRYGPDPMNIYHDARIKAQKIKETGNIVYFASKIYLHLILNEDLTRIIKYVTVETSLDVQPCKIEHFH